MRCSRSSTDPAGCRPRALAQLTRRFARPVPALWAFRHYLKIAPPGFALPGPPAAVAAGAAAVAA